MIKTLVSVVDTSFKKPTKKNPTSWNVIQVTRKTNRQRMSKALRTILRANKNDETYENRVIDRFAWRIFPMPGNQPSSGRTRLIRFNGSRLGLNHGREKEGLTSTLKRREVFFSPKISVSDPGRIRIGPGFNQVRWVRIQEGKNEDCLFWGLKASPVAWTFYMEARVKVNYHFWSKKYIKNFQLYILLHFLSSKPWMRIGSGSETLLKLS